MLVPRRMLAFEPDAEGDWVAQLDCGHRRHVRHRPPASTHAWVLDAQGRASRVGETIECERCARLELPDGVVRPRATAVFDAATLPAALRADHRLRPGSWGRLVVLEGRLFYHLGPPWERVFVVEPDRPAIIPPEIPHRVELDPGSPTRLFIEFLRVPTDL